MRARNMAVDRAPARQTHTGAQSALLIIVFYNSRDGLLWTAPFS